MESGSTPTRVNNHSKDMDAIMLCDMKKMSQLTHHKAKALSTNGPSHVLNAQQYCLTSLLRLSVQKLLPSSQFWGENVNQ